MSARKELLAIIQHQLQRPLPPDVVGAIHAAARVCRAAGELPSMADDQLSAGGVDSWVELLRFADSVESGE